MLPMASQLGQLAWSLVTGFSTGTKLIQLDLKLSMDGPSMGLSSRSTPPGPVSDRAKPAIDGGKVATGEYRSMGLRPPSEVGPSWHW